MTAQDAAVAVLVSAGVAVELLCCLGVLRARNPYARLHFLGPATIIGPIFLSAAIIIREGFSQSGIKAILIALALLLAASAHAQSPAVLGNLDVASDTDGFHATRVRAGGLYPYASWLDHFGVAAQTTHYSQAGWSRDANAVLGIWRNQVPATLAGVNAEGGVVQVAGHTRGIGDATWGFRPAADTGIELIAAGDLVATQKAIDRAVAYGFFAASAEQTFAERFTAIGLVGYQSFTDGNDRLHFRARLIWQAVPDYGINVQLRWRQYDSRKDDVEGAYFNPDRYRQWHPCVMTAIARL
jgi:multisubunit Na+/H+ antiporter MnhG subunit